ncbi:MAG: hypothetical protein WDW36_001499 [Sanguina aurantia]
MDRLREPAPDPRTAAGPQTAGHKLSGEETGRPQPSNVEGVVEVDEAGIAHLLPKVMVPFLTRPGETPRKVQISRKRRLYAQQTLSALLEAEAIAVVGKPLDPSQRAAFQLQVFDNTEYESRTPTEWVPARSDAQSTPALALLAGEDGIAGWKPCAATFYDGPRNMVGVRTEEAGPTSDIQMVARVNVCFTAEDPAVFARRHVDAHASRAKAESLLRYHLFLDSMPTEDIQPLSTEQVSRMLGFALNSKRLKDRLLDSSSLVGEVNVEWARTMNKIVFDAACKRGSSGCAASLMELADMPPQDPPKAAPLRGGEVISALGKIKVECAKVLKMCFFNTHFTKSSRLEEMEQGQMQSIDTVGNYLKDTWVVTLRSAIRTSFKDVGKGWFNLAESNMETYEFSKLRSFLTLTRFVMEDTLRFLVDDSLAKFVSFITGCCRSPVIVKSTCVVEGGSDTATKRAPLLMLELLTSKDGRHFSYSSSTEACVARLGAVFEHAITRVQGIPHLEASIMENLFWASQPTLNASHPQEGGVVRQREALRACLARAMAPVEQYLAQYKRYEDLLHLNVEAYVQALESKGEELSLAEVTSEIRRNTAELGAVSEALPAGIALGIVFVNVAKTRELLVRKKERLVGLLKGLAAKIPRKAMVGLSARFQEIDKALRSKSTCVEDVDSARKYIEMLPTKLAELTGDVEAYKPWYDLLESMHHALPDEDARDKFAGESWAVRLTRLADRQLEVLDTEERQYKEEMRSEQDGFRDTIDELQASVDAFSSHVDLSKMGAIVADAQGLEQRLRAADRDAGLYNSRESLLRLPVSDYSGLRGIIEQFEPHLSFWTTAATWKANHLSWMHDPWEQLNGECVERDVAVAFKALHKAGRTLAQRDLPRCVDNADKVKAEVAAFRELVPLVLALRNPGMRERHWDALSAQLGHPLQPGPSFTLSRAVEMQLMDSLGPITKVSDVAAKEHSIEQALDKMQREWEGAEMSLLEYRDTKTCIIKVDDSMGQQLDDHIVMTQSMGFSPYKKPFEERIAKWEAQLTQVSEVLEQWVVLQRSWMYLEPIFSSEDIAAQLPLEAKRFGTVDRLWRKTTEAAARNPLILKVCGNPKLLEQFIEANKLLESVQKGLADYLETKRLAFARFFFLSNDELLQILSQTKNPLAVQPHLRKCFEAIESLDFQPDLLIVAMNSKEREKVPFDRGMMPTGSVEVWLGEVERRMRGSVHKQVTDSLAAYAAGGRKAWVTQWPAMVVLAASAIFWSKEVEQAISGGKLPEYLTKCSNDLLDLTDLVRGKLSPQERNTLGALITIDVHARDVVQELCDANIQDASDFEWVSRLRYYWRDDGVWVDMVQASIAYGYEYLGNTPRLVITPLTDRCYITLMSAMHLNLGGAPAGPAGTGKTETTKDLAKALAKQCVVFNCSDGLDYLAMGKFLKGLASSGAWACFDEFNRIDLEVLSVVAQQILTIQLAIQSRVNRFIFEDTELDLNHACCVFITMNPGYAGRSELPDNLKALFRPCAMMVPDYALIAEICLYSYGYRNGKELANKMVATFKLCSEQLSSQDHYDYGMRAVKSVITAAGNLKREFPDASEEVLLLRALRDVNYPKFLSHDLPLFNGIITDLFPGGRPSRAEMGIQGVESFVGKVIQLYETTIVRHGLMLVGPAGGGKTCCYRALQKAMTKLAAANNQKYEKVRVVALNPKSVTMGQLYGEFDDNTHEWTDGVLACYMRECSQDTRPDKKWIMFDGPVDAVWIENMNTVLDDNKKLCLVSGEIIQLSDSMTMMFEVEDLAVASPATVSRCGMVYMEPAALGLDPLLLSWIGRLPEVVSGHAVLLASIFNALVPEALRFVRRSLKETVATVDGNLVASCFNVMDALLLTYARPEGTDPLTPDDVARLAAALPPLMIFSIVWSVGGSCDKPGRALFDTHMRSALGGPACRSLGLTGGALFPPGGTVYDWCFDQELGEASQQRGWMPWMGTVPEFSCDPDRPFSEIIVPTADTVRYTFLIDRLVAAGKQVLCVGETGTGKTLNICNKLLNAMPDDTVPIFMTFSARTGANQTQDIIDAKMDKRRKGVYGPPSGKKYVIFVDDVNMPQREKYFAQPPIELLRQWMDHGGWYERKPPCPFRSIVDTQFVGSMGPPGGGRNPVTQRFLRHFNFISFTEMSDDSVARIFTTILGSFYRKYFNDSIQSLVGSVVASTVEIYNSIRAELLPTPSNSHYTFNLRDLAKVIQGVTRADPKTTNTPNQILSLWLHEGSRVFEDRLTSDADHAWFKAQQAALIKARFGVEYGAVVTAPRLIYGDFMVPGADSRVYAQITDMDRLMKVVEEYLEDYNSVSNAPMKLVMFLDAIEHVSRVTRVIRLPQGNMLLLGVGGSGRQSLTRLAAFIEEYEVVQIEIAKGYGQPEWREDLKRVLKKAGVEGRDTVFVFSDTQIVRESFLEDINNILNAGEVPNLIGNDDMEQISAALRPMMAVLGLAITRQSLYSFFVTRVRTYLHLALCFSDPSTAGTLTDGNQGPAAADPDDDSSAGGSELVLHLAGSDGYGNPRELRYGVVRRYGCLWLRVGG